MSPEDTELATQDAPASPATNGAQVPALLELALVQGLDPGALERLIDLQERILDRNAAAAFNEAVTRFQARCPVITKNRQVRMKSKRTGAVTSYAFADLPHIAATIRPHLAEVGLAYSFDARFEAGHVVATCTLRHREGHSVSSEFAAPIDADSYMSAPQKTASALSFAKRYALANVLGLATGDEDDDAQAAAPVENLSPEQLANLEALIDDVGADRAKFLRYMQVQALDELRAADYDRAVRALEAKRR